MVKLRICRSVRSIWIKFYAFWGGVQGSCGDRISGCHGLLGHVLFKCMWGVECLSPCAVETLAGTKLLTKKIVNYKLS